jgi:hypothetical protein
LKICEAEKRCRSFSRWRFFFQNTFNLYSLSGQPCVPHYLEEKTVGEKGALNVQQHYYYCGAGGIEQRGDGKGRIEMASKV